MSRVEDHQKTIEHAGQERRLHVCTFCTHSVGYFPALAESASMLGIDLVVLGWGEKWEGFGQKLARIYEFVCTLPLGDVVMAIDGFDIILLQPPRVILERFAHHGGFEGRFLSCAEGAHGLWMLLHNLLFRRNDTMGKEWPPVAPHAPEGLNLQLLNAGCWISSVDTARKIFSNIPKELNDQKYLTNLYIERQMNVEVDSGCTIFHLWRSHKDIELMDHQTARERYPYKKPFYDETERSESQWSDAKNDSKSQITETRRRSGEFFETPLSDTANGKVIVDVKANTVPCLLHIHCLRDVDSIASEMGLSPSIKDSKSTVWYCWYSFKAHLVSPVAWWWVLILIGVFLFGAIVGLIAGIIGVLLDSDNNKVFLTLLCISGLVAGLSLVLLIFSLLYIDRPRRPPRRCSLTLPGAPMWWLISSASFVLWIVAAASVYGVIWNSHDEKNGNDAKAVLGFSVSLAVLGATVLLTSQLCDKCVKNDRELVPSEDLTAEGEESIRPLPEASVEEIAEN